MTDTADEAYSSNDAAIRVTAHVHGHVQGVGFRYWTLSQAKALDLAGYAKNLPDGRVEVVAEGKRGDVDKLIGLLGEQPSTAGRPGGVDTVVPQYSEPKGAQGFVER